MLKFIVLILLFLPFIEITGIVLAIREFGFMNAFFFWLAATILGLGIVRTSGLRLTVGVARAVREGKPPAAAAIDTALVGVAGILLLIPGYFSDAVAALLLISPLRKWWSRRLTKSVLARTGFAGASPSGGAGPGPFSSRSSRGSSASSDETETETATEASDPARAVIDVEAVVIDDRSKSET